MQKYDVTIIGSGPGGYVCALRCAQLGLKTAIVERYPTLGGTCLNVGCIPSKAWLDSSERYHDILHHGKTHGIEVEGLNVNVPQMSARVAKVVKQTCAGITYLMKKNKIDVFQGHGTLRDTQAVEIKGEKRTLIFSEKIVLATGSKPASLPGIEIDKERIITSTEALKLESVPQHMICIGGGVIGLEIGSVFARLGAKVTVVEFLDSLIASMDRGLGKELQRSLKKNLKMAFYLSHKVTAVERQGDQVTVKAEDKKGNAISFDGDYCLMSVGRQPYTDNLGLEVLKIKKDNRGRIEVNKNLQTSVPSIYAIGDVIDGPMLAHKAEEEGVYVAELITGQKPHIDYNLIPGVVYTHPEVAGVGATEEQLKKDGVSYKIGSFPFKASGRARASNEGDGFIKVLAHTTTDEILGVHMIGPRAADMIGEAVVAMEYKASAEDIARICHAHPTYSEAFKEACLAATENRALHI